MSNRRRPPSEAQAGAWAVTVLLLGSTLGFAGFGAGYVLDLGNQLMGGLLAIAFGLAAAAAITAGKRVVPQDEVEEDVGDFDNPEARSEVREILGEGETLSRRGVLIAAGTTGCAAAAALALPAASLGPLLELEILRQTPWRAGRKLVDKHGRAILAEDVTIGSFATAYPEGADPKALDSPLVLARVRPEELRLPPERSGWAPEGILAYSKICTHAGCAISLFDYPTYPPTQPQPRLVCPCHYSAFDATGGGAVTAGPAGRPLPQLPLRLREDGTLEAAGGFSAPPGPSWSGVRQS